jgi:guanine deaminase
VAPQRTALRGNRRGAFRSVGSLIELINLIVGFQTLEQTRISIVTNSFMARAIELSIENVRSSLGGPFGAVLVRDGAVIGEGTNRVVASNDPTAHAEIVAIRAACRKLATFDLRGCEIYASCEPCPMCLGAIYWARIERIYFAGLAADASSAGFEDSLIYVEIARPRSERKIPMVPLMRDQALEAFRLWAAKPDKISY